MKKQLTIMTASLVLAATLAGCAQPAQRSAAHMNYIGADAAKSMAAADAQVDAADAGFPTIRWIFPQMAENITMRLTR